MNELGARGMAVSWLVLAVLLSWGRADAQTATFKAEVSLRAEPAETAPATGKVGADAKGQVVERKGFWVMVRAADAAGWVKLSALTLERSEGSAAAGISMLVGKAAGRTGTANIVTASGTRGLSEVDLKGASPDMQALALVKRLAVTDGVASRFAEAGGLVPRKIELLTDGEPAGQPATQSGETTNFGRQ